MASAGGLSIEIVHTGDAGTDEWNRCLRAQGRIAASTAIAACAKKHPHRYAWFRAMHGEAVYILAGTSSSPRAPDGGTDAAPPGDR
jgi:hypothetical protein